MKEQILEVVRPYECRTTFEKVVANSLSQLNVKGDFLNDPPTLENAKWFMQSTINDLQQNPKHQRYKYAAPLVIEEEPGAVYMASQREEKGKTVTVRFYGFQQIKKEVSNG